MLAAPARARRAAVERALAAGDVAQAAVLAEQALAAGDDDPLFLNLAAWRREEVGDYRGAHALLRRALALAPGDVLGLETPGGGGWGAPGEAAVAAVRPGGA